MFQGFRVIPFYFQILVSFHPQIFSNTQLVIPYRPSLIYHTDCRGLSVEDSFNFRLRRNGSLKTLARCCGSQKSSSTWPPFSSPDCSGDSWRRSSFGTWKISAPPSSSWASHWRLGRWRVCPLPCFRGNYKSRALPWCHHLLYPGF